MANVQGNTIPWTEPHYNATSTSTQYPAPAHSGRVPNALEPRSSQISYKAYNDGQSILGEDSRRDLIGALHKETPLNTVFFSKANSDKLQADIQAQVFAMSGNKYRIDRQDDDALKIIMRSYYLMFGRNDPMSVASDLADLNARVVGYAAGKIYSELDFHMFYLKDIADFAPAISNPVNTQVYGTRSGELKSFF
jgi:hypothetical protein